MSPFQWLVAGLGNPGKKYQETRHNIGFWTIEEVAARFAPHSWKTQSDCLCQEAVIEGQRVLLVKPSLYMNRSGIPVSRLLNYYDMTTDQLIAIHDDKDLVKGRIQLRFGGSDGGHKGIRSLMEHLNSAQFYRIRIGIGTPSEQMDTADYVLEQLDDNELESYHSVTERAADSLQTLIAEGLATAMNKFNCSVPELSLGRRSSPETV